jgi:hypothetical protein
MSKMASLRGYTKIELAVTLVVCAGLIIGLAIPAIQNARERARCTACADNLKRIGLALHSYHDANKYFPPSATVFVHDNIKTFGTGWSFIAQILPFLDYSQFYGQIAPFMTPDGHDPAHPEKVYSPLFANDAPVALARDTGIPELNCPCNPNRFFIPVGSAQVGANYAFTNYKAMSASTIESLEYGLTGSGTEPAYPKPMNQAVHPDGALFPGKGLCEADIVDGLSNTIQCAETIDDLNGVWIEGFHCSLVGMPNSISFVGPPTPGISFWQPNGIGPNGRALINSQRTYLGYDFATLDAHKYPDPAYGGTADPIVQFKTNYGPSSGHPKVVNHLFCDGSVHGISKEVDYDVYFYAITRNNGDPGGTQWDY